MDHSEEQPSKRRRLEDHQQLPHDINTSDRLQQLLQFRHTITPDVKAAIKGFKDFLTTINTSEDVARQSKDLRILRQYCSNQTAPTKDELDFPDLISTWSFAVETNNDAICSAIPAVLAQFYKTISSFIEFRDFGLSLGHTLLKRDQVRLLERGLSAPKTREHLISPCLRLLTELISFDGGALASRVFDRRDVLFKRLDFLLDYNSTDAADDRRRPTVRRMVLRLMIASLKFLDSNARAEFITHGRLFRNCVRGLLTDGDDIVVDVLKGLEIGLVDDKNIPRTIKSRIFNHDNLAILIALYDYEEDPKYPEAVSKVRDALQSILLKTCTTRQGILLPQTGYYPPSIDGRLDATPHDDYIDLGLESILYSDAYNTNIPVKNLTLSQLSNDLKPEHDTLQSALLLQIMRAAPEIVADYFGKKPKFSNLSSEDPMWRNYFAFLFSVSQLSIPRNFGWQDGTPLNPPPTSIVVESVLPRVLDRTTLAKYLTSKEEILILSATRLLVVVLEKTQDILHQFEQNAHSNEWLQASQKLIESILQRVPKLQEIVNCLQNTAKEDGQIRLALFECLSLYHQILPEATVGSKFDFAATLIDLLGQAASVEPSISSSQVLKKQISHLARVAQLSSATKWWSKSNPETMSLFSQLLHFAVSSLDDADTTSKIFEILRYIANSAGFLAQDVLSFTAMQLSIAKTKKFEASVETWLVLDNAIHRAVQKPVQFLDLIESIQHNVSDKKVLSLLAASVAEQWGYVLKKHADQKDILKNVADWISRLYSTLESVGENFRVMQQLQDGMLEHEGKPHEILHKAIEKRRKKPVVVGDIPTDSSRDTSQLDRKARTVDLSEILGLPGVEVATLESVARWDEKTDIELALSSGRLAKLICCTASVEEIRRQAFQLLQLVAHIIDQSTYGEKAQLSLLLGQLIQTVSQLGLETPLPSIATELAVQLLHIVSNPAHSMYGKVNKFLLRSPMWDLKRLSSYWVREILYQEPEGDEAGAWTTEVEWLIQWHVNALKTDADMEIYRRTGIFEKFLAVYMKSGLARSTKRLILTMVWRGVCVGASNTLITRVGIESWLQIATMLDKDHNNIIQQLNKEIVERCDTELINAWKEDLPVLRQRTNL